MRIEPYVLGAKTSTAAQIGAVALGNVLESYDFLIFSFFAIQIGKAFFPARDDNSSLLSLATFGLGLVGTLSNSGATVATGICGVLSSPLGGWFSDSFGRKPVTLTAMGLLFLIAVPCFIAMVALKTPSVLYACSALMAALLGLYSATLVALSENVPTEARSGGIGIIFALATSLFGGTTQFGVTWLIGITGSALAPAWYMMAFLAVSMTGMALLRETAPIKIDNRLRSCLNHTVV